MRIRKLLMLLTALYIGYFAIFSLEDEFAYTEIQAAPSPLSEEFTIPVLTYHSITDQAGSEYAVNTEQFKLQIEYLHSHGYHSINLKQFDTYLKQGKPAPDKLVLLTFDDGYRNNYDKAFPILQKYGFTAALFVITDWVNSKPYMSWTQIKELGKAGWDIMPHSRTHPHLPLQSKANQQQEIAGSKLIIERIVKTNAFAFAYPYGHRSQTTMDLVQGSGYDFAFTFDDGLTTSGQNPYLLKRLIVSGKETLKTFSRRLP
ncbi:polysaccharide deacetylase family protein [Paenibacillus solisilvae]|uniref:Polysaccharide deacetylase family protein n=1 Tax=Paenibacillus solisilvae TaxID=2486751 RepID=A0ABW0W3J9_9BACL